MDLVRHYSNGRTASSKELTSQEAQALISHLNDFLQPSKPSVPTNYEQRVDAEVCNNMRRKIISYFRQMGYQKFDPVQNKMKADMDRINEYILKVGFLKKELNSYNRNDLTKLVTQIELIYNKHLKNVR
jgi:hypothetical protein